MSFWDFFWLIVLSFFFFAFLVLLFQIFADLFRDKELGGWGKAAWCAFVIITPWLGSLVYLIARGGGMARRQEVQSRERMAASADYIRSVAGTASPAQQVAEAKALLDSGAISEQEFASMKARALARTT